MNHVTAKTRNGALIAAAGGVVAVIGVFMPWATARFGGDDFLPGFADSAAGTGHLSGILALLGALAVLGGAAAALLAGDGGMRRIGALAAGIGGLVVVVFAIVGFFRAETMVTGGLDFGFTLEELGIEAGRGLGVFVTAIGGIAGAVGGFMAGAEAAAGVGASGTGSDAPPEPPAAPG